MAWQQPLTIRTAQHVAARHPRCGLLDANGLNRIEGNIAHLAGRFGLTLESYTGWQAGSLVFERDMNRTRTALAALQAYSLKNHPSPDNAHWMPEVPDMPLNHYEKINQAETIQLRTLRAANQGAESWRPVEDGAFLGAPL